MPETMTVANFQFSDGIGNVSLRDECVPFENAPSPPTTDLHNDGLSDSSLPEIPS